MFTIARVAHIRIRKHNRNKQAVFSNFQIITLYVHTIRRSRQETALRLDCTKTIDAYKSVVRTRVERVPACLAFTSVYRSCSSMGLMLPTRLSPQNRMQSNRTIIVIDHYYLHLTRSLFAFDLQCRWPPWPLTRSSRNRVPVIRQFFVFELNRRYRCTSFDIVEINSRTQ